MENGVREHASDRAATTRRIYGAGVNLIDVGSLVRGAPALAIEDQIAGVIVEEGGINRAAAVIHGALYDLVDGVNKGIKGSRAANDRPIRSIAGDGDVRISTQRDSYQVPIWCPA